MAELGHQTVAFSTLVSRAAEESFLSLKELVEKSKSTEESDSEKKISLLKYLVRTQQRMLRLNVLAKWCQQVPLIQYCQQLASTLSSHDACFVQASDSLFFMHEGLQQARAPIYDVPSAIEVLLTGSYQRLPKCIEDVCMQGPLTHEKQKQALKKLDVLVRSKLLEVSLPKEISEVKISDGTALLRVNGEFMVLITLGYRGHLSMWRILHLELLVGEKSGFVKLEESRRHTLGDDLERRMTVSDNPFGTLYSILHELCVALIMDTVIRQVQALRQGRWKDAIRFELITDGHVGLGAPPNQEGETDSASLRTPGLKILYWLDLDKPSGTSELSTCPFIKVEPGQDMQIKCLHSSFVMDPLTGKEAEFSIDPSCINVEKLLLRAIFCNRFTRLLEIQKELGKNVQICRAAGDVALQSQMDKLDIDYKKKDSKSSNKQYEGQEVLRVRAYGSLFFTLGINIRNGRFLLQSSQNVLTPSALLECEESLNQGNLTAAEVFITLRSKSLLHLFASIGRFIGLEVYDHGNAAIKVPKNFSEGSNTLMMGFPDCGSSYFLLLQLDRDFKPLFRLLETLPDQSGKGQSSIDFNSVSRLTKIDISQMPMLEDELNLSLLDLENFPRADGTNPAAEHSLLSEFHLEGSLQISGYPASSFSSVIDEVFELEKPGSALTLHVQNLQAIKPGTTPPKLEVEQNVTNSSSLCSQQNGPLYASFNTKGPMHSNSLSPLSPRPVRNAAAKKLSTSKSNQESTSLKSPNLVECNSTAVDGDQLRLMTDASKDVVSAGRTTRVLSSLQSADPRVSLLSGRTIGPGISPSRLSAGSLIVGGMSFRGTLPISQGADNASVRHLVITKPESNKRKRMVSDVLNLIPSLWGVEGNARPSKKRKICDPALKQWQISQALVQTDSVYKIDRNNYGNLITEANKGSGPPGIYVSALLHVVRHCSLCIKHARLTSQMTALDIPYVEEVGLRSASSNIWFRLPVSRGYTWSHICLRLGRPGSMYWDVQINDQHFRDLWELQKGSSNTPWGSGVRIANTSDVDSHIRYDPEGVVLSYQSVEADSIKKLVMDIRRLSNARVFALGMWKLLGVRADEKSDENTGTSDMKAPLGPNGADAMDKISEQMRKAFRIEAVGLMSLWFSFGSGVLARFVVEWESCKEGCTMHVSPDQLWPHTKFLEDFINGAEVGSLLDCIRLTAGPLHALAAATRPARAGQVPGAPGVAALTSIQKQAQGLLPSSSVVNHSIATAPSPHNLHGAAMLAAAGRGGPGIVPSSLLPIDVSVVLRGPYWIRIIYRKHFAVDMRCFAGDQVWLQPATPPKGGPSVGGSLPCPQFRPFIMEHVAQELNGLEPGFPGAQQTAGIGNSNNQNTVSGSQLSSVNGNRVGVSGSAAVSRPVSQANGLSRVANGVPVSSNLAVVNPVRRSPGTVPAHVRGELNTAIIGLGDDGGYGGGWVPLVALKKVLRGILKYLGVLWLFAQLPDLLKEILGSILKDNEGALLNLDQEQPALRFFVGGYVFAVSVHRVQLLLQVLSVKRFHHQQQQPNQQNTAIIQEELSQSEIAEICDYFSRRVASEPYDASRVASFITLLTLPISVLKEFLKLIAWKKGTPPTQGDVAPVQKPRIELCLENHTGFNKLDENSDNPSTAKSNIYYDKSHSSVDFALTVVLDPAHIPHLNAAGGAAWLPQCVSVRMRYSFGENSNVSFLGMEGSHGGRACWIRVDDWEKCKQRVGRTVEVNGSSAGDVTQGRLRIVADSVQRTLHSFLQCLRDGTGVVAT